MNNLKKFREKSGMNQTELSKASGVIRTTINRLEVGAFPMTMKLANRLCGALKCKPEELLGEDAIRLKTINAEGKSDLSFTEVINGIVNSYTTKFLRSRNDIRFSEEFLNTRDLKLFTVIRTLPDMTDDQLDALANFTRAYTIENHIKERKDPDYRVLGMGK